MAPGVAAMSVDDIVVEALESDNLTLQVDGAVQCCWWPVLARAAAGACAACTCIVDSHPLTSPVPDAPPLQNMAGGRWVQGNPKFLDAVTTWQRTLGAVDVVLGVWGDVQRKWQALQSIFVGSADIRVQLPEDSARFSAVDAEYRASDLRAGRGGSGTNRACVFLPANAAANAWYGSGSRLSSTLPHSTFFLAQELMAAAPKVTNVAAACTADGRQEALEGMLGRLETCEKALQARWRKHSRCSRCC